MNLKGYIFSRSFCGERVPQHVQNIVIRDYCKKKKIDFLLSSTEYRTQKSTYILSEIIKNFSKYDGIIFYSLLQLPEDKKTRHLLIKKTLKEKKEIHFAVENIAAKNKEDFIKIEKIFLLRYLIFKKDKKSEKNNGKLMNFVTPNHKKTKRNYLERMVNNKIHCMKISKKFSKEYWDGDRKYGYGGYRYINGYHTKLAKKLIDKYSLNNNSKILDIGCGKGFLLFEIKKILKKIKIVGFDISKYAIKNSKKEIKNDIFYYDVRKKINFKDKSFDLVISINTLHNLKLDDLHNSIKEIERIGKNKYICVESYRNEKEQFNLQCWALTAETLIDVDSWKWVFSTADYSGDYEFIYFE